MNGFGFGIMACHVHCYGEQICYHLTMWEVASESWVAGTTHV